MAISSSGGAGLVKVYDWIGGSWTLKGSVLNGNNGDSFGNSVSLSSNGLKLVVGSAFANSQAGYVKKYEFLNGDWSQEGSTLNGDASSYYFGQSVSLSSDGTIFAVGIQGFENNKGQVKVYQSSSIPQNPTVGQMYYSASTNRIYIYNGTAWTYVTMTVA